MAEASSGVKSESKIRHESVQLVVGDAASDSAKEITDEYEDIFAIESLTDEEENKIWINIGGIEAEAVVDSGTRYNVMDRMSWIELKAKNIITTHRQKEIDINFRSYGGYPLKFIGLLKQLLAHH